MAGKRYWGDSFPSLELRAVCQQIFLGTCELSQQEKQKDVLLPNQKGLSLERKKMPNYIATQCGFKFAQRSVYIYIYIKLS